MERRFCGIDFYTDDNTYFGNPFKSNEEAWYG